MSEVRPDADTASADADSRLRGWLGDDLPPAVLTLSEADKQRLADLVHEARRRQAKSLEESFEATLKHVPFAVRRLVKKVLLG